MSKVNILHLIGTTESGGAENVLLTLAASLNKRRYNSLVALLGQGKLHAWLKGNGIAVEVLDFSERYYSHINMPLFISNLCHFIKKRRINLVHSHLFGMNLYGCLATRLSGIPMIATVHDKYYVLEKGRRSFGYKVIGTLCSKLVAVSYDIKDAIQNCTNLKADRIMVIHNGVDLGKYTGYTDIKSKKRELGLPPSVPIVGTVGELSPVKGHKYLLKAAAIVLKGSPHVKFLIVGDGHLRKNLESQCKELGIEQSVILLGFRNDVAELLKIMNIFTLTSISEGLSLAILEAMAAGKPVVATDVGGNSEIIVDDETGFLVPPRNPDAIASKIMLLLENEEIARDMGKRAQKRVEERFSLERMVKTYEELYERCLNEKEGHG